MKPHHPTSLYLLAILAICLLPDLCSASVGSGGGLPYEDWLEKFRDSVTGPIAFTFGLVGIVTAGSILIFGGELNAFMRSILVLILIMAFIVAAQNILSGLFGRGSELTDVVSPTPTTTTSSVSLSHGLSALI